MTLLKLCDTCLDAILDFGYVRTKVSAENKPLERCSQSDCEFWAHKKLRGFGSLSVCENCGAHFPAKKRQKFCSVQCQRLAAAHRVQARLPMPLSKRTRKILRFSSELWFN